MSASKQKADVYIFSKNGEYATFMLFKQPRNDDPCTGYFACAIESSFGGFAHSWSHLGCDFHTFLCGLDHDYVAKKMLVHEPKELDVTSTAKLIRQFICEWRRSHPGEKEKRQARREWLHVDEFESTGDFSEWLDSQRLFDDAYEYASYRQARSDDFERLYRLFWPLLREALEAERLTAPTGGVITP